MSALCGCTAGEEFTYGNAGHRANDCPKWSYCVSQYHAADECPTEDGCRGSGQWKRWSPRV